MGRGREKRAWVDQKEPARKEKKKKTRKETR
jgi:hypothetical protein